MRKNGITPQFEKFGGPQPEQSVTAGERPYPAIIFLTGRRARGRGAPQPPARGTFIARRKTAAHAATTDRKIRDLNIGPP
jgi:hypothetical protein